MNDIASQPVLHVRTVLLQSWQDALGVLGRSAPFLVLFALSGGMYAYTLVSELPFWVPLGGAVLAFLAGTELSRRLYAALLGQLRPSFLALAHANLAVYAAFIFIGFFVGFFLLILPGILIEAAGTHEIGKESDPVLVQEAFLAMLATPFGAFFMLACAAGAALLGWIALRLTLFGAATVAAGQAMVFRSWSATRGLLLRLAVISLGTHVLPFCAAMIANGFLHEHLPATALGSAAGAAGGILLFSPFLLAGHAMAARVWSQLAGQGPGVTD